MRPMDRPPAIVPPLFAPSALLALLAVATLATPPAAAAWSTDPYLDHIVADPPGSQYEASVVTDGSGGAFVAWQDTRLGSGFYQIYVQHIAADGSMSWADDGILAGYGGEDQFEPAAASDGAGGVIVAWEDGRGDGTSIYAQRLDAAGNRLWRSDGLLICDAVRNQGPVTILADGAGGAFLAWDDRRRFNQEDIFGQRVGPDGAPLWAASGVEIQVDTGAERYVTLVPDGAGGVVALTADLGADVIRARRLTAGAATVWGPLAISDGPQNFPEMHAVPDGTGGAFVVWRSTGNDLKGQHVDGTGALHWNGGSDQEITPVAGSKTHHRVAADGAGGIYVTWTDWRSGVGEVFVQHLDAAGTRVWGDAGVLVDDSDLNSPDPNVTDDGDGNALVTWIAHENADYEVQAQKYSPGGTAQWAADGVDLSIATAGTYSLVEIVPCGDGGAITVFRRYLSSATGHDLLAKKMNGDGGLGTVVGVGDAPLPSRAFVTAYPNPFRAQVQLAFAPRLEAGERVEITDAAGRRVRSLQVLGDSPLAWDGRNAAGRPVVAGIYFVRAARAQGTAVRLVRLP